MPPRPVTKKEAARLLGVSVRTIERRVASGALRVAPPTHGPHGPEARVYLGDAVPVATATPAPDTSPAGVAAVGGVAAPPTAPTPADEVALAALRLVDEVMRENAALRAEVQSLRERQAARPGAVQRAWAWLRRGRP